MYCVKCGIKLKSEYRFCFQCGAKVPTIKCEEQHQEYETSLLSEENETTLLCEKEYETSLLSESDRQDEDGEMETVLLHPLSCAEKEKGMKNKIQPSASLLVIMNVFNGEEKVMKYTKFTIGSDRENTDFYIKKSTVSRCHATIIFKNGEYFIVDNHSTNGTMIDGKRITPEKEIKLYNGALIQLADELLQISINSRERKNIKSEIYDGGPF